jgi:Nif-specific regulatory protein
MRSIKRHDSNRQRDVDQKLHAILNICRTMNAEKELPTLLNLIAREATRLMEADRSSVFLLDRERHELWSIVTLDGERIRFDARLGLTGAVAMTGQTINVEDAYQDSRFYKEVDARTGYRTGNMLIVPLRNHEGQVIGTFQVLNKKNRNFTKDDEDVLQTFALHVATTIETAQLVDQLKHHREQLLEENTQLWKEVEGRFSTQNIIGTSPQIQNIVRLIEQISDSSVNVLITGESGTGKELVAKAIHYNSSRARGSFVTLNSAAMPESLVESELFGIEKGTATGVERRIGKFEVAHGGTLFLDEIGDLSLTSQAKILRALQEGVIERVGGRKEIPVDVRVLAATNKDLEVEIEKGYFRRDLYYRLKVIHIEMPALREVPEDIAFLVNFFLAKYCREMKKEQKKPVPGVLRCLMNYAWPGNVRQLENEIKRLVVLTPRKIITEEDLSEIIRRSSNKRMPLRLMPARKLKDAVEELERGMVMEALEINRQNQRQTAKALGLSRWGLIKKMKRYGIKAS